MEAGEVIFFAQAANIQTRSERAGAIEAFFRLLSGFKLFPYTSCVLAFTVSTLLPPAGRPKLPAASPVEGQLRVQGDGLPQMG